VADTLHFPASIPGPERCYALLTDKPEFAVVFVHGFYGDSRTTWYNFQGLVDKSKEWAHCDLFFYNYLSYGQIKPLAEKFRAFIEELFPFDSSSRLRPPLFRPQPFAFPSGQMLMPRPERAGFPYKQLILVGHSTGAVIIREAVLQEIRPLIASTESPLKASFMLNAALRFFAPAHRGAMCSGVLGALLHLPMSEWILGGLLQSNPLFKNLQPGSPALEDIRRETEGLQDKFKEVSALFASSLFGEWEAIVHIGKYIHDPDYPTEPKQTHTSVCKPNIGFLKPLEFVTDAFAGRATAG
jgi:pimeloyl-ACP methyl ester carboxylesterase